MLFEYRISFSDPLTMWSIVLPLPIEIVLFAALILIPIVIIVTRKHVRTRIVKIEQELHKLNDLKYRDKHEL